MQISKYTLHTQTKIIKIVQTFKATFNFLELLFFLVLIFDFNIRMANQRNHCLTTSDYRPKVYQIYTPIQSCLCSRIWPILSPILESLSLYHKICIVNFIFCRLFQILNGSPFFRNLLKNNAHIYTIYIQLIYLTPNKIFFFVKTVQI